MKVFSKGFANQYDYINKDKNYVIECDLLEEIFRRYGQGEIKTIVDFGCGSGSHLIPLFHRGYKAIGVDLSEEMLQVARRKALQENATIDWIKGDIRSVNVGISFDAGLFMFAVLGYMLSNEDIIAALTNARRHIRIGGLLIFDVWFGPAVLTIKPTARVKVVPIPNGRVIRAANPSLDICHHQCVVHYHLWQLIGDHLEFEGEELHTVRFFFPMELDLLLKHTGFVLNSLSAFPSLDRAADETSWNALVVATAI
jgi:SAM-dependent methyltransferase